MAMSPPLWFAAGVLRSVPSSLDGIWSYITSMRPTSGLRLAVIAAAIWGRFVGWSEVAVRALSLFFGMLTLAWVYRTGRDLLAPRSRSLRYVAC